MFYRLLVVWLLLFFHLDGLAAAKTTLKLDLEQRFDALIDEINDSLKLNQQAFASSPQKLADFADQSLLPLWSSEQLLKRLFSRNTWSSLSSQERLDLKRAFYNTMQRYVQEGFAYYDGQTFEFVKIRLNKKQTRGYLTVKLIPQHLPSFELDFKIGLFEHNWHIYDVIVKGVSYITLKKEHYRALIKEQGTAGALRSINEKNKGFLPSKFSPEQSLSQNINANKLSSLPRLISGFMLMV